ncbi:activator of HSP90 ATPase [Devosia yakushimensis]|uniref:Activator of HSP90 ATPase n=1 Tax=Devosia yakushimensis TaxID=470028 RepID=A0ABQ5UF21_9HYPH|nr:SRPBCC domain-containing protein [Devosia yakushimensis]GLQ09790.1 activator of HSP90 ATPase [Devosia yakushimensis]
MNGQPQKRGFTVTRTYPVPPQAVFAAWTEPDLLGWFFNPGMPVEQAPEVDLRVGGAWRQLMVEHPGKSYVTGGIYREIDPPRKLVFNFGAVGGWPDLAGGLDDALLVTLLFNPMPGGGTEMICRLEVPPHVSDEKAREWFALGIEAGWLQTIERLKLS